MGVQGRIYLSTKTHCPFLDVSDEHYVDTRGRFTLMLSSTLVRCLLGPTKNGECSFTRYFYKVIPKSDVIPLKCNTVKT
jgi:hypothetical protein